MRPRYYFPDIWFYNFDESFSNLVNELVQIRHSKLVYNKLVVHPGFAHTNFHPPIYPHRGVDFKKGTYMSFLRVQPFSESHFIKIGPVVYP